MITASHRIIDRTCRRLIPTARRSPISRVRSKMESASVFTMPTSAIRIASPRSAVNSTSSWSICFDWFSRNCV